MAAGVAALPYDTPEVRALLEHVRDYAIFVVDPGGRVVTWNAGARAMKGYVEHDIVGQHISRFYTSEDRAEDIPGRLLAIAARDGRVESEGWRVRQDGSQFWADVVITALKDDRSALVGFLKVTRDLTERRNAEAALRKTEENLAATLYSIGDAVISTDIEGRVVRLNPVAERLTGWPEAEAMRRPISEVFKIVNEETGAPAFNPITRILAEGVVVGLANHTALISRDGAERPIADSGAPIRGLDGAVQGAVLVFRDVSEERDAEKAIRSREQQLARQAAQQAAVAELGLFAIESRDLQPVLDRAVTAVTKSLGTDLAHVLELQSEDRLLVRAGIGWKEGVVGHASLPVTDESFAGSVFIAGQPLIIEDLPSQRRFSNVELLKAHGVVSGLSVVIPVTGESSRFGTLGTYARQRMSFSRDDVMLFQAIANVVGSAVARARAEEHARAVERQAEQERQKSARAEQAVRERDVFVSVAAHELRTPLTALQLTLQGLDQTIRRDLDGSAAGGRIGQRFRAALRQTERLTELAERLLDVSRIAAGGLQINRAPLNLQALVSEVVVDFQEQASRSRTEITVESGGDTRGHWDQRRLEQVILNLLSNAEKYGAGRPVRIHVDGLDDTVRMAVADEGIGIAGEDQARIFGAFERAAPVENFGGLGLGLYISRRIVEAHGGHIELSSAPGRGTTVVVTLPRNGARTSSTADQPS